MTPSRPFRVLFLTSMFVSMSVVMVWAGVIGWRKWPEWRAVREMRGAVEANEPGRFLAAIEAVDQLGVAEAAADEIAPLRHHPDPRVRLHAVIAHTVLGPRGLSEARELIAVFDDPNEDIRVRCAAAHSLALFQMHASEALPSLIKAIRDVDDGRNGSARATFFQLGYQVTDIQPPANYDISIDYFFPPELPSSRREMAGMLAVEVAQYAPLVYMQTETIQLGSP